MQFTMIDTNKIDCNLHDIDLLHIHKMLFKRNLVLKMILKIMHIIIVN